MYLEEGDKLGDLEARRGVHGLDDEVYGRAAGPVAARVVHADGGLLRRRLEAAGVEVAEDGHEGVVADVAAAGDEVGELEAGPLATGGGGGGRGLEFGEVVEEEGAPGGEDAAVDGDGGAALGRGEFDLGVGAVEEGRVEQALQVVAEAAEADGLEVGRRGPRLVVLLRRRRGRRRRGREADGGDLHGGFRMSTAAAAAAAKIQAFCARILWLLGSAASERERREFAKHKEGTDAAHFRVGKEWVSRSKFLGEDSVSRVRDQAQIRGILSRDAMTDHSRGEAPKQKPQVPDQTHAVARQREAKQQPNVETQGGARSVFPFPLSRNLARFFYLPISIPPPFLAVSAGRRTSF